MYSELVTMVITSGLEGLEEEALEVAGGFEVAWDVFCLEIGAGLDAAALDEVWILLGW